MTRKGLARGRIRCLICDEGFEPHHLSVVLEVGGRFVDIPKNPKQRQKAQQRKQRKRVQAKKRVRRQGQPTGAVFEAMAR